MRISDWSSDVCSSDLQHRLAALQDLARRAQHLGEDGHLDDAGAVGDLDERIARAALRHLLRLRHDGPADQQARRAGAGPSLPFGTRTRAGAVETGAVGVHRMRRKIEYAPCPFVPQLLSLSPFVWFCTPRRF